MGWKNIKEHYKIKHSLSVTEKGICIGSPYIHDIIVISKEGKVIKEYDSMSNKDLLRYQSEMNADLEMLRTLTVSKDVFTTSIKVYTYHEGEIIEKFCEELGWPNCTHDGETMYENTFTDDLHKAIGWCKNDAEIMLKMAEERVDIKKEELKECIKEAKNASKILRKASFL